MGDSIENNDMYSYLVDNYGSENLRQLDNGGYIVTDNYDQVYVGPDCSPGNISMLSFIPGDGGSEHDAKHLMAVLESDTPPDCVVTIAHRWDDVHSSMELGYKIANDNGMNVDNALVETFSHSGGTGFQKLSDFSDNHPDVKVGMLVSDGFGIDVSDNMKGIDNLLEKDIPIVLVGRINTDGRVRRDCRLLQMRGFNNVFYMETTDKVHGEINRSVLDMRTGEFMLGLGDMQPKDGITYTIQKMNPGYDCHKNESDENVMLLNCEMDEVGNFFSLIVGNDLKISFSPKEKDNILTEGTVSSNLALSINYLNQIRSSYKTSINNTNENNIIQGGVVGEIFKTQNTILNITDSLFYNLDKETELIANTAQVFYDMDSALNYNASLLPGSNDYNTINKTLNDIINTNITLDVNYNNNLVDFSKYLNTEKLSIFDLEIPSSIKNNYDNEIKSSNELKTQLHEFKEQIDSSKNFYGEAWKSISNNLSVYEGLMDDRIEANTTLYEAYEEAINLLKKYMGEYTELDYSQLDELKESLNELNKNLAAEEYICNSTVYVKNQLFDGHFGGYYKYEFSESYRMQAAMYIGVIKEQRAEVLKEIKILEGLPEVLKEAEKIINDAMIVVYGGYQKNVSQIVTGKSSTYIPVKYASKIAVPTTKISDQTFEDSRVLSGDKKSKEEFESDKKLVKNMENITII